MIEAIEYKARFGAIPLAELWFSFKGEFHIITDCDRIEECLSNVEGDYSDFGFPHKFYAEIEVSQLKRNPSDYWRAWSIVHCKNRDAVIACALGMADYECIGLTTINVSDIEHALWSSAIHPYLSGYILPNLLSCPRDH
jgi:hypothetical protein